jgi:hypothetical protein
VLPLRFRFLNGSQRGRELTFTTSPIRIGRSRDNDVVLPEVDSPLASARHAEILWENGHWWIVDLGSTNGTRLNGSEIRRARLGARDHLTFADQEVEIRLGTGRRPRLAAAALLTILAIGAVAFATWRAARGPLDAIARAGARSAYLIVLDDGERRIPVGTAFAIDANGRLATNAHVASPIGEALRGVRRGQPLAIPDGGVGAPVEISAAAVHPGWKEGSVANDVALLTLTSGTTTVPVQLSTVHAVSNLRPGTTIAIYAFPAAFTDPSRPQGSLLVNSVREVDGSFLEVGIAVGPGASGGPVFTSDGLVVGIVAGRRVINGRDADVTAPAVAVTIAPLLELLSNR